MNHLAKILRFQELGKEPGKHGAGVLGTLIVEDLETGARLELSTDFTDAQRDEIWQHWPQYGHRTVLYKLKGKLAVPTFVDFAPLVLD